MTGPLTSMVRANIEIRKIEQERDALARDLDVARAALREMRDAVEPGYRAQDYRDHARAALAKLRDGK